MAFGSGTIWMNGKLVAWADANIHIASHVIHYGSGVFEGARCYLTERGSACFRIDDHVRRLYDSARIYRMEPTIDQAAFQEAIMETIRANAYKACYIRPLMYRGYGSLGINPKPCPVDTAILLWEWGAYLGDEALERGVDVRIGSWARAAPNTYPSMAKSTANYANAQLLKLEAMADGYAESLALDPSGHLSEGSGENVFLVRDDVIYTPPMSSSLLPGLTRSSVITIARDLGVEVREQVLPREFLYLADEAFFVGTAVEVTPIRSVDRLTIGRGSRGPVTEIIQRTFFDIVNGRAPDTHHWLTYVYPGEPTTRTAEASTSVAASS